MNCEIATARKREIFDIETLSFEGIPDQSKLFIDFQNGSEYIRKFYPSRTANPEEFSRQVLDKYEIDRDVLCDNLAAEHMDLGASEKTLKNIEKLRETDCVTVIAGQQAGLFSGSMYTVYKALSAIKLADELTMQGIKAVPVFWIASEDHDFEEVNKTYVLNERSDLVKISNKQNHVEEHTPVGYIKLGKNIKKTIDEYLDYLPNSQFTENVKSLLKDTYRENETYSSAFAKLVLKLFGECGLILVCPMNKGLSQLCVPVFAEAIERHQEITDGLLKRNKDLSVKKYHSQVFVGEDFFPFFYLDKDNKRKALRFDSKNNTIRFLHSEERFGKDEFLRVARESPHQLSPNALMRPVAQDFLFPTICYYGGSSEIAYFAQNEVIYKALNRPVTHFRHRASFTVVDPKSNRTLKRYGLEFKDVFRGREELLARVIEKFISGKTAKRFTEAEDSINAHLDQLDRELINSDPTLSNNLAKRRRKILWHIDTLRKKFHKAETFRNETLHRRIEYIIAALYPRSGLQERTVNIVYFYNLFGPNLIEWLYKSIDPNETEHRILFP